MSASSKEEIEEVVEALLHDAVESLSKNTKAEEEASYQQHGESSSGTESGHEKLPSSFLNLISSVFPDFFKERKRVNRRMLIREQQHEKEKKRMKEEHEAKLLELKLRVKRDEDENKKMEQMWEEDKKTREKNKRMEEENKRKHFLRDKFLEEEDIEKEKDEIRELKIRQKEEENRLKQLQREESRKRWMEDQLEDYMRREEEHQESIRLENAKAEEKRKKEFEEMRKKLEENISRQKKYEQEKWQKMENEEEIWRMKREEFASRQRKFYETLDNDRRETIDEIKKETERMRRLREESLNAYMQGQPNAPMMQNAMRQNYERGMRDAMAYVKQKMEEAQTKENGIIIIHEESGHTTNLANEVSDMFTCAGFIVPPLVPVNEGMPPIPGRCNINWLVLYIICEEDAACGRAISLADRYTSQPVFSKCEKLVVLQCTSMRNHNARLERINAPVIATSEATYHNQLRQELNKHESFTDTFQSLMSSAKMQAHCFVKD